MAEAEGQAANLEFKVEGGDLVVAELYTRSLGEAWAGRKLLKLLYDHSTHGLASQLWLGSLLGFLLHGSRGHSAACSMIHAP